MLARAILFRFSSFTLLALHHVSSRLGALKDRSQEQEPTERYTPLAVLKIKIGTKVEALTTECDWKGEQQLASRVSDRHSDRTRRL